MTFAHLDFVSHKVIIPTALLQPLGRPPISLIPFMDEFVVMCLRFRLQRHRSNRSSFPRVIRWRSREYMGGILCQFWISGVFQPLLLFSSSPGGGLQARRIFHQQVIQRSDQGKLLADHPTRHIKVFSVQGTDGRAFLSFFSLFRQARIQRSPCSAGVSYPCPPPSAPAHRPGVAHPAGNCDRFHAFSGAR